MNLQLFSSTTRNCLKLLRVWTRPSASPFISTSRCFSTEPTQQEQGKLGILGAGLMGSGIAQVASQNAKRQVILVDTNEQQLLRAKQSISSLLDKQVAKGKFTAAEKDAVLNRITTSTDIRTFSNDTPFVIEAVTENPELKVKIFQELTRITPRSTILASNTSTISITQIAGKTDRQENIVGLHFFNPVPVMPLVEVIPGLSTSTNTFDRAFSLAVAMGKTAIRAPDTPGFIVNRILLPYLNEAVVLLAEGSKAEDIDACMKLGANVPMGPLTLADFVGLDTTLSCLKVLEDQLGPKYKPHPLLVKYVNAGRLGRKSGIGFYDYTTTKPNQ